MAELITDANAAPELREVVRARYAAAARAVTDQGSSCDCGPGGTAVFGGPTGRAIGLDMTDEMLEIEAARVLKPGGRFAVSDVIADADMDDATRADVQQWTGCIAGALTETEFRDALSEAGLGNIRIRATHRVHAHASSAIIRARKERGAT